MQWLGLTRAAVAQDAAAVAQDAAAVTQDPAAVAQGAAAVIANVFKMYLKSSSDYCKNQIFVESARDKRIPAVSHGAGVSVRRHHVLSYR
uniref:Uncharacterized protein n=1 Tax=Knipowitschia caucasica TaxID=637954 RepID=A0AAV2LS88_KNICA